MDKTSCTDKYNKVKARFSSEIIDIIKELDAVHTRTKRIAINNELDLLNENKVLDPYKVKFRLIQNILQDTTFVGK